MKLGNTARILVLHILASSPSWASLPAEKGAEETEQEQVERLIADLDVGTDQGASGLAELFEATEAIEGERPSSPAPTLELRRPRPARGGKVRLGRVFAAHDMALESGRCEARPARLRYLEVTALPSRPETVSVCAQLRRGPTRLVQIKARLTTGRGMTVAETTDNVRFEADTRLDHISRFEAVAFPETGTYRCIIEIDGEQVSNTALFEVRRPPPGF